jgi:hypothetical protein
VIGVVALHHHARTGAHHVVRRLVQYAPAGAGDLRHVAVGIHLGEQHQAHRIVRIHRNVMFGEQAGETSPEGGFWRRGEAASGNVDAEAVAGQPDQPVQRRVPWTAGS